MPCAPKLQRTARRQVQRQVVDIFVVNLRLMIDTRQPSKGTSERSWIVVLHYSIIVEYRSVILEAVEGTAQGCQTPARSSFI
jgi:hypothetical protein